MAKQIIILVSVVFFSLTVFTVQTLPRTPSSSPPKPPDIERLRNMTEEERKKEVEKWREQSKLHWERLRNMTAEERKRELAKMRKQRELELAQKKKELAKRRRQRKLERAQKNKELAKVGRGPLIDREQRRKESQERWAKIRKEFLTEKSLLGATEEQWKLIKAKLEKVKKVRQLHEQARSTVGMFLAGGSSDSGTSANVPAWQWKRPWKDKAPSEMTEAQRLAKELIALVERKNTTPQAFRRKMDALRKARSEQAQFKRQLSDARRELCEILTTRQEAALVLMNRL